MHSGSAVVNNKAGLFGAYAAGLMDDIFGLGSLIWPVIFAVLGAVHLASGRALHWWRWAGFFLLTLCFMAAASAFDLHIGDLSGGGIIGNTLQTNSTRYLSPFGAFLLWSFIALIGVQLSASLSWVNIMQKGKSILQACLAFLRRPKNAKAPLEPSILDATNARSNLPASLFKRLNKAKEGLYHYFNSAKQSFIRASENFADSRKDTPIHIAPQKAQQPQHSWEDDPFAEIQSLNPSHEIPTVAKTGPVEIISPSGTPAQGQPTALPGSEELALSERAPAAQECPGPDYATQEPMTESFKMDTKPQLLPGHGSNKLAEEKKGLLLPTPELLDPPIPYVPPTSEDLRAKGRALMGCFADFDIQGELARITPGPVVTMFEVRPAPGIRVSKISNLSDDLGLALKAIAVRIQAPIPGSDTVGIEIPNDERETVNFRELVESEDFTKGVGPLTMVLGKTIAGHPFMADLTRMPHMLVAGATGAGKSVCLNSILLSLLFRHTPKDLRLLLVDPKRIEMAVYSDLPHLVHPVVTEMDDAKNALAWAVEEMENRFKTFMRLGVRNIAAYHAKLESFQDNAPPNLADLSHMPYMVIVIDELADLMLTAARDVEPKIQRLAQLARAAGIHMILATQRPSVDVVTGLIKAQFPCRISFQVSSKHDSRTILDQVGAEHLLGRGDMLFKPAGGKLLRLHGPFVSDEEVHAIVTHWKEQQAPDYQVDFSQWGNEPAGTGATPGSDAVNDPLYQDARNFVLDQGRASISLLQRHLKIGFNRAARLMEQFERDGIIGPADGSKPRTVIK